MRIRKLFSYLIYGIPNPPGSKSPFALREQLNKAIDENDIAALQKTIEECEETGYAELGYDLSRARDKLHSLGCGKGG